MASAIGFAFYGGPNQIRATEIVRGVASGKSGASFDAMSGQERQALTRDVIAQVALQITETDGLAKLSMRKLGAELGVEAMSLYHYVDNKDDLLQAMTDRLYAEIELPSLAGLSSWEDAVRGVLRSYHEVLISHSAAVELFLTQPSTSSRGLDVMTWVFELLTGFGLSAKDAVDALHFSVSFVSGHVATELSGNDPDTWHEPDLDSVTGLAVESFYEQIARSEPNELFESGLDMLVLGLRSRFQLP